MFVIEGLKSAGELRERPEAVTAAIIGAGPAGLTAGYLLSKQKVSVLIFEADPESVGGASRTVNFAGFLFDLGKDASPSASDEVTQCLETLACEGDSPPVAEPQIYWNRNWFTRPLNPAEVLLMAGPWLTAACLASWFKARCFPIPAPDNLQEWLSNEWGRQFYSMVFKSYAEKVWGLECREIPPEWGCECLGKFEALEWTKQRLLLSVTPRVHFRPYEGVWQKFADRIMAQGGRILMGNRVTGCAYDAFQKSWHVQFCEAGNRPQITQAEHLVSSAPLPELLRALHPRVSEDALSAVAALRYRDRVTVALRSNDGDGIGARSATKRAKLASSVAPATLPQGGAGNRCVDIYDPSVKAARLRILKAGAQSAVARPIGTCFVLEYFCSEGDALALSLDETLLEVAQRDLTQMGFGDPITISESRIIRQEKVFPIDDAASTRRLGALREELGRAFPTLHLVGCNGLHNNRGREFAPGTATLCVENILAGHPVHDLWTCHRDPTRLKRVRSRKYRNGDMPRCRPPTPGLAANRRRIGPPQPG